MHKKNSLYAHGSRKCTHGKMGGEYEHQIKNAVKKSIILLYYRQEKYMYLFGFKVEEKERG